MGFWSSVGSFVGSVCSAVGSAISSTVSAIGTAVSSFASGLGAVIGGVIEALAPVAEAIGKFANAFLTGLGILKPDEDVGDMGERALQAAEHGITMDKFDNFEDYMEAIRDFEIDEVKAANRKPSEKLLAGMSLGTVGVEDKYNLERGSLNGMWLLPMANADYFTPERMESWIQNGRLGQGEDIFAYLSKKLEVGEANAFEAALEVNEDGTIMREEQKEQLYSALDSAVENHGSNITRSEQLYNERFS